MSDIRCNAERWATESEWKAALEWLDAWDRGVAVVNPMTAAERDGFMRTLTEIKALPEEGT